MERITREQYDQARVDHDNAEKIMQAFHKQKAEDADARFAEFSSGKKPYADEELLFAAWSRCPCGHGLAYPKECGHAARYWDCAAIWKGLATPDSELAKVEHTAKLPFAFYSVKSEDQIQGVQKHEDGTHKTFAEVGMTTRGTVVPKPKESV